MENKIRMEREKVVSLFINRVESFFLMFDKEISITSLLKYCGRSLPQFSSPYVLTSTFPKIIVLPLKRRIVYIFCLEGYHRWLTISCLPTAFKRSKYLF